MAVQGLDNATDGAVGNFLDHTVGADPVGMARNIGTLVTSSRDRRHILEEKLPNGLYTSENRRLEQYMEDVQAQYFNAHGEEMDKETLGRFEKRYTEFLKGE